MPRENNETINGIIVFSTRSLKGDSFEYDSMCVLLDTHEHLNNDTDLLYYNSKIKDEFGVFTTENHAVRGPMCPNDGEEVQFWKEEYFEVEYFMIDLDRVPDNVKYLDFLLFDYERFNGASEEVCTWDWNLYGVEIYEVKDKHDILGKNTIVRNKPTIRDYPQRRYQTSRPKDYPHCRMGRLQRRDGGWIYVSIWEGIKNIENRLQSYLV